MILSGILLTPTGEPYKNSSVRITANNTSQDVLQWVSKDFKTDVEGTYSIDVPNGWYYVSVFVNDFHSFTNIGNIEVTDATTQTTINELLMIGQTAHSDPLVAQVAADAASALASKNAAVVSGNSATSSANSATASQTSASSSQASASSASTSANNSSASATASASSASSSSTSATASAASAALAASLLSTKANLTQLPIVRRVDNSLVANPVKVKYYSVTSDASTSVWTVTLNSDFTEVLDVQVRAIAVDNTSDGIRQATLNAYTSVSTTLSGITFSGTTPMFYGGTSNLTLVPSTVVKVVVTGVGG